MEHCQGVVCGADIHEPVIAHRFLHRGVYWEIGGAYLESLRKQGGGQFRIPLEIWGAYPLEIGGGLIRIPLDIGVPIEKPFGTIWEAYPLEMGGGLFRMPLEIGRGLFRITWETGGAYFESLWK